MTWNVRRESNQNPNTIRSFRPLQNRMNRVDACFMHRLRSIRINVNQSKKNLRWPEPIEKARIKKRNADMHLLLEV